MSTDTLQFRVGADTGIILANISQEKLLYNLDIKAAFETYSESFGNECPEDILFKLVKGDMVVLVDTEEQMFMVADREAHHDAIYPAKIDFKKFFDEKQKQMDEHCKELETELDKVISQFKYRDYHNIQFSSRALMNFLYHDDDKDLIDEIHDDHELAGQQYLIKVVKDFIEKSMKLEKLSKEIKGYFPNDGVEFDAYDVWSLMVKLQKLGNLEYDFMRAMDEPEDEVMTYLENVKEIDARVEAGMLPVDIMDKYDAGWLSPEGDFYGLNGQIANMLHIQIGDALQKQGIIPMKDDKDWDVNPDSWLEQQGWVKIHGNNINFGGCLNSKIDKKDVNITEKQLEVIVKYINGCHQCILLAGWRRTRTTANLFAVLGKRNMTELNNKYFTFG